MYLPWLVRLNIQHTISACKWQCACSLSRVGHVLADASHRDRPRMQSANKRILLPRFYLLLPGTFELCLRGFSHPLGCHTPSFSLCWSPMRIVLTTFPWCSSLSGRCRSKIESGGWDKHAYRLFPRNNISYT